MSTPSQSPEDRRTKSKSHRKGSKTINCPIDFGSAQNNSKLMSCLNIVNNQLNTRRTYREDTIATASIHDQFTSLSKAYDSSQEKILQLEESLMQETLVTEKQRSIIEVELELAQILKQLLEDSMDDETVLSFLGELSKETPNSSQLCQTILSIKNVLERQKLGAYLKNSKLGRLEDGLRTMEQRYEMLKSEFIKVEEQNRGYSKEIDRLTQKELVSRSNLQKEIGRLRDHYEKERESMRAERDELSDRLKELERELDRYHHQLGKRQAELDSIEDRLRKQEERSYEEVARLNEKLYSQQEHSNELQLRLKKLELSEESLRNKYIEEMNEKERIMNVLSSLQEVVNGSLTSRQTSECNTSRALPSSRGFIHGLPNELRSLIEKKDALIEKYRGRCSKLMTYQKRSQSLAPQSDRTDVMKTEVFILKKFLTEEAVRLIGEYQQNPKEYLQKEIVELAKLETQKRLRLQHCEQELWRTRSKLLQYEEQSSPERLSRLASHNSKTRLPEQPHLRVSCSEFQV